MSNAAIGLIVERRGKGILKRAEELKQAARETRLEAAAETERRAKLRAPVDHGRLRSAIESGEDSEGAFVRVHVDYGGFQEFGTMGRGRATDPGPTPEWYQHSSRPGGVPAHPYLRPAFYEVVGRVGDIMRRKSKS